MASGAATGPGSDAKIAGINEANVNRVFPEPPRVGANRQGSAGRVAEHVGLRVGLLLGCYVLRRLRRGVGRFEDLLVTAVAIGTTQPHGWGGMHGGAVGLLVAALAAGRLLVGFLLAFHQQKLASLIGLLRGGAGLRRQ